jgi:hypothetical protein
MTTELPPGSESPEEHAARVADEALSTPAQGVSAEDDLPQDQLRLLSSMVIEMSKLQLREIELEQEQAQVKRALAEYATKLVPNQMLDMGVDQISMRGSGAVVRIETAVHSGLSKDTLLRKDAYRWLADTGNDELIKRDVTVSFDRSSTADADALMTLLATSGFDKKAEVTYEWTVHSQTLGKFVRDTLAHEAGLRESGEEPAKPIPRKAFGIFEQKIAVIERKKVKR